MKLMGPRTVVLAVIVIVCALAYVPGGITLLGEVVWQMLTAVGRFLAETGQDILDSVG